MEKLWEILRRIKEQKIWTILREWPWDIDIFSEDIESLKLFFAQCNAVIFFEDSSKLRYYLFISSKRITFDIEKNFKYIWKYFFGFLQIQDELHLRDYHKDKDVFDTLRYIFEFRHKKVAYFSGSFKQLLEEDFYMNHLRSQPFRKKIVDIDTLKCFLRQDIITLGIHLKIRFFLLYLLYKIIFPLRLILKRVFSNNTYAILWYDGSGKTTICEVLAKEYGVKSVYMWYRRYSKRWYYNILWGNNIAKLLRLILMWGDFWLLYIQIFYYRIRYEFVFFDRHPSQEIYPHSGAAQKAIRVLFSFYPKAKKNFILYNTPEVIHTRKKERSIQEIDKLNQYILEDLRNKKRNIVIKNDAIDQTLNTILGHLYYRED